MHSCLPPCVRTYIHNAAYDTQTVLMVPEMYGFQGGQFRDSGSSQGLSLKGFKFIRDHPGTEARRDLAPV